ncbi:MAG: 4Fe-4S ferredoxin, iron-sulfur binding protein [Sedimentibacter sp.]|jgi:ferredoxin|nr:4Fe-4S ferredoxin, iron-sulfur binding protein [Sedimentibacter sp.]
MKAIVDRDACISCGLCVSVCPEVFELDDEDISTVIQDPVEEENEDTAREAADGCPTDAIIIEE